MQRELKFRVWDKTNNVFIPAFQEKAGSLFFKFGEVWEMYPLGDFIIQQFTGLKDKNGKEIYEGDILKNPNFKDKYDVRYNNYTAAFELWNNQYRLISMNIWEYKEIIGNIFENPELLENK